MTAAEFQHLIETRRISIEWAIDCRAHCDISGIEFMAWGPTALAAVERLAMKAGWLDAGPLPLFETQEGESS